MAMVINFSLFIFFMVLFRAFGVLVWETLTLGQQPYPGFSNTEVLHHVRSGGRLESPNNCPDDL